MSSKNKSGGKHRDAHQSTPTRPLPRRVGDRVGNLRKDKQGTIENSRLGTETKPDDTLRSSSAGAGAGSRMSSSSSVGSPSPRAMRSQRHKQDNSPRATTCPGRGASTTATRFRLTNLPLGLPAKFKSAWLANGSQNSSLARRAARSTALSLLSRSWWLGMSNFEFLMGKRRVFLLLGVICLGYPPSGFSSAKNFDPHPSFRYSQPTRADGTCCT